MSNRLLAAGVGVVLALGGLDALAHPEKYGPFEKGKEPKPFPVRECVTKEEGEAPKDAAFPPKIAGIKDGQDAPQLKLCPAEGVRGSVLSVLSRDGKVLAGPWYAEFCLLSEVQYADLNADGKPDFIVRLYSGGCGLAGASAQVIFATSHGDTYVFATVNTYEPDDCDFVDLGDGRCRYVQTSFVYGSSEPAADGKHHNFWVHSLLAFDKEGRTVVDNAADPRFPAWIWYTNEPNHLPTRLLTDEQKCRLWERQRRIFGKFEHGDARQAADFAASAGQVQEHPVGPCKDPRNGWQVCARQLEKNGEFGVFVRKGDDGEERRILTSCRAVEAYWMLGEEKKLIVVNDLATSSDACCLVHDLRGDRTWRIDKPARQRFEKLAPPGNAFDHLYATASAVSPDAARVLLSLCGHGAGTLKAARSYVVAVETGEVLAEYDEARDVPLRWWQLRDKDEG